MRKCPGCGALVSPTALSCPSCKRGLRIWHVRTLTGACGTCAEPILLHTAFERHEKPPTGYSVTMIGSNSAEVSSTGGAVWVAERRCPKCGEERPLKRAFRPLWRSWALWLWILWPAFVVVIVTGSIGPINPGFIVHHFVLIYSVLIGLPILLYWRRRRRVNALLRKAFGLYPKTLELEGYDLFAMCRFIRRRIKKKMAISVDLTAEEGTLPATS
jgi:hypothetical protein